jgi:methionyl-tRNA formyltransferase
MAGCHEAGWDTVNYLLENGFRFNYFVSITEEEALKQNVSGYKSFADLALIYKIPIYFAKSYSLKTEEDIEFFKIQKFDVLIQGGWQRLFPDNILNSLQIGAIGVHGSSEFLPKGRGRSPINWSLIEGKSRFILHYFLMKSGVDDGDIIHYEMFDINSWDNCKTLYYKISILTARFYLDKLKLIINGELSIYQQLGDATYYTKRSEKDGLIDWSKDVFSVHNFIRGITHPYPGAFSYIDGNKINIWAAQPFDTRIDNPNYVYGQICFVFGNDLVVKVSGGLLLITDYSINGKVKLVEGLLFSNS